MKLKNPLAIFDAIKNSVLKNALNNATDSAIQYLKTLDLDKDGQADIEEITIWLKDLQSGIEAGVSSINGEQVVKCITALETLIAAFTQLGELASEVLDTEQAKAAQIQLAHAIKVATQYIKDVAEATKEG